MFSCELRQKITVKIMRVASARNGFDETNRRENLVE